MVLQAIAIVLLVLIFARLFGSLAERLGQPAAVGELLGGVALAFLIPVFADIAPELTRLPDSQVLNFISKAGIFALVLFAGIEMRPQEVREGVQGSIFVAIGGVLVPLGLGFAAAWFFMGETENRFILSLLTGTAISITAIPATAKVLEDMDLLHTPVGKMIISAALVDDIAGIFLLGLLVGFANGDGGFSITDIFLQLGEIIFFFALTSLVGMKIYPTFRKRLKETDLAAAEISFLSLAGLLYALLAEMLGMHWIIGVFMAGLYFDAHRVGKKAYEEARVIIAGLCYGVLGPLFFATIGLNINPENLAAAPGFLFAIILCAFFGKIIGAGIPARFAGLNPRDSLAVGVGMSSRGAVELIILSLALQIGILTPGKGEGLEASLFSNLALMAVVTTALAPALLKHLLKKPS